MGSSGTGIPQPIMLALWKPSTTRANLAAKAANPLCPSPCLGPRTAEQAFWQKTDRKILSLTPGGWREDDSETLKTVRVVRNRLGC